MHNKSKKQDCGSHLSFRNSGHLAALLVDAMAGTVDEAAAAVKASVSNLVQPLVCMCVELWHRTKAFVKHII